LQVGCFTVYKGRSWQMKGREMKFKQTWKECWKVGQGKYKAMKYEHAVVYEGNDY